jgi:hypothetical protein
MSLTTVLVLNLFLDVLIFGLLALVMRTPFLLERRTRPAPGLSRPATGARASHRATARIVGAELARADGEGLAAAGRVGERARRQTSEAGLGR